MKLIERLDAAQKSVGVDWENAKTTYRQGWEVLLSDKPGDEFFGQANALFVMLSHPLYAVPAAVVNTVRAFLKSTHKLT